jgi:hypothetical protein
LKGGDAGGEVAVFLGEFEELSRRTGENNECKVANLPYSDLQVILRNTWRGGGMTDSTWVEPKPRGYKLVLAEVEHLL